MEKSGINIRKLLSVKSYVEYWLSTSFSMTASNLIQFVLSLYVLELTGSAAIFASMLSIIIFPRILLTPFSGVMGDKFRRLSVMKVVLMITSLILLLGWVKSENLESKGFIWVYFLVVSLEICEVFYQASESAILSEIVPPDLIPEAVSLSKIDDGIVFTATPALGTLIYRFFGVAGGLWLTFILFSAAFILSFFITTPYYNLQDKKQINKNGFFRMFSDGIKVIRDNEFLKRFIFIVPLFNFFFSSVYSITIAHFLLVTIDAGETAYGIYRSVTASMVIFVPVFLIPFVRKLKMKKLLVFSSLFISMILFFTALAVSTGDIYGRKMKNFILIAVTLLDCLGIATMMPVHMSISVFYQKSIPHEVRSRVLSVMRMLSLISIPLGNICFGVLTDKLPASVIILGASFGTTLCYFLYRNTFRYMNE